MTTSKRIDIYQDVTDRILAELERGTESWAKSWSTSVDLWRPTNRLTEAPYRGINLVLLAVACARRRASSNAWLTFNQARELGGVVRKGSKGVPLVLYRPVDEDKESTTADDRSTRQRVLVRHFHVFHAADIDGLTDSVHQPPSNSSLAAQVVRESGIRIVPGEPCYRPSQDIVQLPEVTAFRSEDDYYATALHELVHATAPRVEREVKLQRFGDQAYAMEELVAELGAAMLCGACGIPAISQCAAYLDHWLRVLRADKRAIFTVAAQAQRAADYLISRAEAVQAAAE